MPPEFGDVFIYGKVFYSEWDNCPVTVQEYVPGDINNDGNIIESGDEDSSEIFKKAECLVHFTYSFSEKKLMVLDIQGSGLKLYDPEIVTTDLMEEGEVYFCAGNLSTVSIETFAEKHKCNKFCKMMKLQKLE